MPMAKITPMGESGLYHIHFLSAVDPGFGHGGGPVDPGYGRPGGGHIDNDLPGSGAHPGNRPPGSGSGGIPGNELPPYPPPTLLPGYTLVMVRGPHGHWEYAFIDPGSPPPKPLPPGDGHPDNTLPGSPVHPGNRPPGSGMPPVVGGGPVEPRPPHVSGGPVPTPPGGAVSPPIAPTPAPKR